MTTLYYIYNARYPNTFEESHVIFQKYTFAHEFDTSEKRQGLPGLCNLYIYPMMPCKIPNIVIPIRKCDEIGYGKFNQWPRVQYYWWSFDYTTSLDTMLAMLGTSFVSCRTTNFNVKNNVPRIYAPIVPNMRISNGFDALSNTACLKLNFNGTVEPVWLGKAELNENVGVYLERLPILF